ncbi:hypothetical protein BDV96DRAFT_573483 [Lophiotrema nucula]|uniref:C3H1-type domain-containing protein n=1 Tax=Lophiotrema nucula TaxID=690887 RepID=A0A6A5Z9H1_9PLEO|nr:hypothetical protein BDV96DRAFT_573483 [Lophiotrema nucula]
MKKGACDTESFRIQTQEAQTSYAMVLIDAHTHMFQDEFVQAKSGGGSQAARRLLEHVTQLLKERELDPGPWQICVDIFADLKGLSNGLHKLKLSGPECRGLAPFFTDFSASHNFFNFVDVGHEASVPQKIKAKFEMVLENHAYKHIFFCACCRPEYISMLEQYPLENSKITVIAGADTNCKIATELRRTEDVWPQVFRKGITLPEFQALCKTTGVRQFLGPSEDMRQTLIPGSHSNRSPLIRSNIAMLPTNHQAWGVIKVNEHGHRLDDRLQLPSAENRAHYNNNISKKKPCNHFYLTGRCDAGNECRFYHPKKPPHPDDIAMIKYIMMTLPCGKRGECRVADCYNGHHCQKTQCKNPLKCKMPCSMHGVDTRIAHVVEAVEVADQGSATTTHTTKSHATSNSSQHHWANSRLRTTGSWISTGHKSNIQTMEDTRLTRPLIRPFTQKVITKVPEVNGADSKMKSTTEPGVEPLIDV